MDVEQIKSELTSSLLEALSALVQVADERGIETALPTFNYDVIWFEDVGGSGQQQRVSRTGSSAYGIPALVDQLAAHEPARGRLQRLADSAASALARGSWPAAAGFRPGPEGLATRLVQVHASDIEALTPDRQVAALTCSRFVDDVLSPNVRVESIYLISAPEAFWLDEQDEFKPISMDEIEQFGAVAVDEWLGSDRPWLNTRNWICKILDVGAMGTYEAVNRHYDHIEEILGALNLTSPGRVSCRLLSHKLSGSFFGGPIRSSRNMLFSSGGGTEVVLDESGVTKFQRNYSLIKRVFAEPRLERLKLPLRRLRSAASRTESEDKLVDYVIGLERLLAPDSESLEVAFRFRLRGAAILSSTFGDADEKRKFMGRLYKLRSDIVHGNVEPSDIDEMVPKAESALVSTALWFGEALETANY